MLSADDAEMLRQAGFLDWEISQIGNAKTSDGKDQPPVDLGSEDWVTFIEGRNSWIESLIADGLNKDEIEDRINEFYDDEGYETIWDFFRDEYKEPT